MIVLGNQPAMAREPHRSLFFMYLKSIGLDLMWIKIVEENRGSELPYHNTEHLMGMAHISRDIAMAEGVESTSAWMKVILSAALIHDVNHAGSGRVPDATNIERAIRWFDSYVERLSDSQERDFFLTFGERIKASVKVTEFPFIHTPVNQVERILRDADVLWSYQREAMRIVNVNLYGEINALKDPKITQQEFFEYNENFYRNTTWFTDSAKVVADHLIEGLIQLVRPKTK